MEVICEKDLKRLVNSHFIIIDLGEHFEKGCNNMKIQYLLSDIDIAVMVKQQYLYILCTLLPFQCITTE